MTISAPVLWVLLPMVVALITAAFPRRKALRLILPGLTCFGLSLLALLLPENLTWDLGPVAITFETSLGFLGRQITIVQEILPFIAMIFMMNGLWLLAGGIAGAPATFNPISLMVTALLTAALGVQPFLYAALLIEAAVLVAIPMLTRLGEEPPPGILRFITLQTLAMPFILLAGWLLNGVDALPADSPLVLQSALLLGLGLALWLAVFPFHSWVPMVSQHSHPLSNSFLQFIFPTVILVFSLNFINRYSFLRESETLFVALRAIGTIMIVFGGAWTAVQNNLCRGFGFSALTETGFSLLTIGLAAQGGLTWMLLLFPARALAYWLWGVTLTLIESHTGSLDIQGVAGLARRYPVLAIGLTLAQFSIAGLPLLASFPVKMALLSAAFEVNPTIGAWVFIGALGLPIFAIRSLVSLVKPGETSELRPWSFNESAREFVPIGVMVLVLVVLGLFPQPFLSGIVQTLTAFGQLP